MFFKVEESLDLVMRVVSRLEIFMQISFLLFMLYYLFYFDAPSGLRQKDEYMTTYRWKVAETVLLSSLFQKYLIRDSRLE